MLAKAETPAFKRMLSEEGAASVPVVEAVRDHIGNIIFGIGAKIAESGLSISTPSLPLPIARPSSDCPAKPF
jgi:hypothetical protein